MGGLDVLQALRELETASALEVAEYLGRTTASTRQRLRTLEARGLATRDASYPSRWSLAGPALAAHLAQPARRRA